MLTLQTLPPPPPSNDLSGPAWQDWFYKLRMALANTIAVVIDLNNTPGGQGMVASDTLTAGMAIDEVGFVPGPQGPRGFTGLMGPPGMMGEDGEDGLFIPGAPGARGPQGPMGPPGMDGEDGADGPPGPAGATGATGPAGPAGSGGGGMGAPGMDGEDGGESIVMLPAGKSYRTLGVVFDGGGSTPTVSSVGYVVAQFTGRIDQWSIVADASGSAVVDVWKAAGAIPTIANTIAGSEKPTLTAQQLNSDTALTTWSTTINVGDVLGFNLDSVSGVTRITVEVRIVEQL